jgi:hypothetical protein
MFTSTLHDIARARPGRFGISTVELLVSIGLLGLVLAAIGKMQHQIGQAIGQRELYQAIGWELENAKEEIQSWPSDRVTQEQIEQLSLSESLTRQLDKPQWQADISKQSIDSNGRVATRVRLWLKANHSGQAIRPVELTFWRDLRMQESPNGNAQALRDASRDAQLDRAGQP